MTFSLQNSIRPRKVFATPPELKRLIDMDDSDEKMSTSESDTSFNMDISAMPDEGPLPSLEDAFAQLSTSGDSFTSSTDSPLTDNIRKHIQCLIFIYHPPYKKVHPIPLVQ